eukprot:TRINITY_DN66349_c0_g2_i2.p1 TRINITY_DN66349_c0_g2~~TRINITY_DN66349_c0_g2_i2.p1  ORF type:complete len:483 (-),score=86.60 TRINITY_DN66349_c0_g2_i2:408-1856(-)
MMVPVTDDRCQLGRAAARTAAWHRSAQASCTLGGAYVVAVCAMSSLVVAPVEAMSCFSEMNFGWCTFNRHNPAEPPSCPNYTFSIATFQQKLLSHYNEGLRPPLMEAYFLTRLHQQYRDNLVEIDCPSPLVMAHLLVSELNWIAPPWENEGEGWEQYDTAMKMAKQASPFQQHLMIAKPAAWPLRRAMDAVQKAQGVNEAAYEKRLTRGGAPVVVHFVVAHCKEPLDWLSKKLGNVPPGAELYLYEKCGEITDLEGLEGTAKFRARHRIPRPDVGHTRGDECSAYLSHIVGEYGQLADFTIFLQSDPQDHLHFDYLDLVLRSMAAGTYTVPYLPLNGPRHVRTLTPCLSAVHEDLFGTNLTDLIGPYCCAQFAVARETILRRTKKFYMRMLGMVDGSNPVDLCGIEGAKRSTQCYGYEFLWHIVFGETVDPPNREDDRRLPVALRLKQGKEHTRLNWAGVPLARDIPIKIVPDYEHGNPLAG